MNILEPQELIKQADGYRQDVKDQGYAIGTGIILVLVFIVIVGFVIRFLTNTVSKKLDEISKNITELTKTKDEAMKGATDREARIIEKLSEHHNSTMEAISKQNEKTAILLTGVSIIVNKSLTGDDDAK